MEENIELKKIIISFKQKEIRQSYPNKTSEMQNNDELENLKQENLGLLQQVQEINQQFEQVFKDLKEKDKQIQKI